jgi:parallel beta-helix repeat protein
VDITIKPDGSVDPQAAPIHRNGNLYTLADNIFGTSLIVQKDGVIIDGAGFSLQGSDSIYDIDSGSLGIDCSGRSNVTLMNVVVQNFGYGIRLDFANNNTIARCNITSNRYGVWMQYSLQNRLINNTIVGNFEQEVQLTHSSSNTLSQNCINEPKTGIIGEHIGFKLLSSSDNNAITKNVIDGSNGGIYLDSSSGCFISENTLRSAFSIRVYGTKLSDFLHEIDASNLANGYPIYYLVNQSNLRINPTMYPQLNYLAVVNSVNVTIEGLNFRYGLDRPDGLLLAYTNNSLIQRNTISYCGYGMKLVGCYSNTLSQNTMDNNQEVAFSLEYSQNNTLTRNNMTDAVYGKYYIYLMNSYGNLFHHNNFITAFYKYSHNPIPVYYTGSTPLPDAAVNSWDDGHEGNYWSEYYNGTDANRDGIGDTPYCVYGNNRDNYPLISPVPNSGFTIPEFPSWSILTLFTILTLIATVVYWKKRKCYVSVVKKS